MHTPCSAPSAGVISSSWRMSGLIGAEHAAAGDPEQEAVADLAGGPGDRDADRFVHAADPIPPKTARPGV